MSANASGPSPPVAPRGSGVGEAPHWLEALDHAGLAIFEAHLPTRAARFTSAFLSLLGYPPEALEPRLDAWRGLLHPQDVLRVDAALIRHVSAPSEAVRCECRLRAADGGYRNLLLIARAGLRDEDGRAQRLLGSVFDLGDLRGLESALADYEARFSTVFEHSPVGLAVLDLTGRWREVNPALCDLLGYEAPALCALGFQDLTPDEDLAAELELAQALLAGERDSYRLDKRLRRQDGSLVAVTVVTRLIRDGAGQGRHFLAQILSREIATAADPEALPEAAPPPSVEPTPVAPARGVGEGAVVQPFRARAGFLETLDAEVHLAQRGGQHLALLLLGLDGLSELAVKHGQAAADAMLAEAGQRLRHCVRRSDLVSRFGADAFAVLLKQLDRPEQALRVVETLVAEVPRAVSWRGHALRASLSLGASLFPQDGDGPEALLQAASRARYLARETGGNGFRFADGGFDAVMSDRSALFAVLRRALEEDAVGNRYRPLLGAEDGTPKLLLVEAVILNGAASPVPVADLLGEAAPGDLLEQVQAASAQRALEDAAALGKRFGPRVPLAFRPGRQRLRPANFERCVQPVVDLRCDGEQAVGLLLDEREVARLDERVFARLVELRRLGVSMHVDGFGAGLSNFARLTQLGLAWIVVDEDLARRGAEGEDVRLLKALIRMARCLDAQLAWPCAVALPPQRYGRIDIDAALEAAAWQPDPDR